MYVLILLLSSWGISKQQYGYVDSTSCVHANHSTISLSAWQTGPAANETVQLACERIGVCRQPSLTRALSAPARSCVDVIYVVGMYAYVRRQASTRLTRMGRGGMVCFCLLHQSSSNVFGPVSAICC
ncbi:hypothetical protein GGS23DRAFT_451207 [Durotheca rogersii]|uniref:uncharacterized protein n=1 Tax=Durotheca rogersii TaxID=419775 RepID=UPI00221F5639|nr:uncharacterized protein GGS23DRAFT_451207 [Durotheca rogersii]KAI5864528.1 hypothetical protein GGS23DRAFT_451207 [Durotheca rogersii]